MDSGPSSWDTRVASPGASAPSMQARGVASVRASGPGAFKFAPRIPSRAPLRKPAPGRGHQRIFVSMRCSSNAIVRVDAGLKGLHAYGGDSHRGEALNFFKKMKEGRKNKLLDVRVRNNNAAPCRPSCCYRCPPTHWQPCSIQPKSIDRLGHRNDTPKRDSSDST